MRSPAEVRAEIERLRKRFGTACEHDPVIMAWAAERSPALIRKAALEWVLSDEQDKPKEIGKCPSH